MRGSLVLKAGAFVDSCSFAMHRRLRVALRIARLRRGPRVGHVGGYGEPPGPGAPQCFAFGSWHGQGSVSVSSWVAPIGHTIQLRPYSVAPARDRAKPLDEEAEEDLINRKIKKMEQRRVVRCAQRVFMDYLYVTRGICFSDAESMSKRAPAFISKLLEQVNDAVKLPTEGGGERIMVKPDLKTREMRDQRVSRALIRLLNFHPINEFEPFFESIGLKPNELHSFLPRDLMFLSDDELLLVNYRILCNYGIARNKIGRIYREAREVFSFGDGVLASKLKALEDLGFSKTGVIKLVISTPVVLVRDTNVELKILQWLDDIGIQRDWISQFLSARKSYNWRKMVEVPEFFSGLGFTKEGIGILLRNNPGFLLDGSGKMLFAAVLIMLKAGYVKKELFDLFLDFPNVPIGNFARNLQKGILFLADVGLNDEDIKKFVVSNGSVLGSAPVMKSNSVLTYLSVGKKRLCKIIMEDPRQLMNYTFGSKIKRLPRATFHDKSLEDKIKFLKGLGFVEGSADMKKALKAFRGKGSELQDRYDFLVKTGLDPKDVVKMIKNSPQVLNQKIDVLQYKISTLVNGTGYPLNALVGFPAYLSFTVERTQSRILMHKWLVERGLTIPQIALSTLLACSEKRFIKDFAEKHPEGLEVWKNLKREVNSARNTPCTSDV